MTDHQDNSRALREALDARERLAAWRKSMPAVWYGNAALDAAIKAIDSLAALSPPGSEPAGVGEPVFWVSPNLPWACAALGDAQREHRVMVSTRQQGAYTSPLYASPAPAQQAVTDGWRSAVRQAVARGWCAPENAHKVMDPALADAIAREILAINAAPALNTTAQGDSDG